jgi:hypothetical protein
MQPKAVGLQCDQAACLTKDQEDPPTSPGVQRVRVSNSKVECSNHRCTHNLSVEHYNNTPTLLFTHHVPELCMS